VAQHFEGKPMISQIEMNLFQKIRASIAEDGLLETLFQKSFLKIFNVLSDALFDYKYGTETKIKIPLYKLTTLRKDKNDGVDYAPTNYFLLKKIFNKLNCNYSDSNFVDFGAGKGRAMLVASEYGFKKVKGIEFSPELCEIGKKNMEAYLARAKRNFDFEFIPMDATKYVLEDNDNVLFFYNPFGPEVIEKVLDNIETSLKKKSRTIYLIYVNPAYSENFSKRFKKTHTLRLVGKTYIFKNIDG
jgi:predicted RNA methylase